jgi:hypothetical protein
VQIRDTLWSVALRNSGVHGVVRLSPISTKNTKERKPPDVTVWIEASLNPLGTWDAGRFERFTRDTPCLDSTLRPQDVEVRHC